MAVVRCAGKEHSIALPFWPPDRAAQLWQDRRIQLGIRDADGLVKQLIGIGLIDRHVRRHLCLDLLKHYSSLSVVEQITAGVGPIVTGGFICKYHDGVPLQWNTLLVGQNILVAFKHTGLDMKIGTTGGGPRKTTNHA